MSTLLRDRRLRLPGWIALIASLGVLLTPIAPPIGHAQEIRDWTAAYRPALLPDFAGDMLAHADAPRYAIDLTLAVSDEGATITGHQAVTYTNRAPDALDEIVFRLYPNLPSYGADMRVSALTVNGAPVAPRLDATRTVLSAPLPDRLAPGACATLEMDFTIALAADRVRLYAQFSYLDGVLALPNAYPVLSVYEPGGGWWQVTDHPQGDAVFSETAFYTVSVTAPAAWIVVASGSEVDMAANGDGTLTHRYVAPLMRDFALMASQSYVALAGEQDGVTVTLYYDPDQPGAAESARAGLEMALAAVRVFNAAYGRYPFAELDIVQTPTLAGGIEYPGLIVVASDVWNLEDEFFEFVIAHEAAHQWWYSLVGNDQALHPWMDEALAQYSVALYVRDREGDAAYEAVLASFRAQYEGYVDEAADRVIGEPAAAYPDHDYYFFVYQKGPLFYAALEDAYGLDRVRAMLADYCAAYRYAIAGPDDMLRSFEASLGADLDAFFAEWVGTVPVG